MYGFLIQGYGKVGKKIFDTKSQSYDEAKQQEQTGYGGVAGADDDTTQGDGEGAALGGGDF